MIHFWFSDSHHRDQRINQSPFNRAPEVFPFLRLKRKFEESDSAISQFLQNEGGKNGRVALSISF